MNPIREAMNNLPGHWYQGNYSNGKRFSWTDEDATNFCGLGHVYRVADMHGINHYDSLKIMNIVAGELYPDRTGGEPHFPRFNDHPDTTEEDVLTVMKEAAIRFEEQI